MVLLYIIMGNIWCSRDVKNSFNHVKNEVYLPPCITCIYAYCMLYGLAIDLIYKYYINGPKIRVENWSNYI